MCGSSRGRRCVNTQLSLNEIDKYLDMIYKNLQVIYRDIYELYSINGTSRILDGLGSTINGIQSNIINTKRLVVQARHEYDEHKLLRKEQNIQS